MHAKSVLIGILDSLTKQHTLQYQATKTDYQRFREQVMTFVNGSIGPDDKMVIGRVDDAVALAWCRGGCGDRR